MFFAVAEADRRQAKSPHELAMVNLLIFNLLTLIALLGGSFLQSDSPLVPYRWLGVAGPLGISLAILAYTVVRATRERQSRRWFVAAHWRLASRRYRVLAIVYLCGAGLIALGWLLAHTQDRPDMQAMMFIALERVAIAPLLIALMVLVILESGALYQAGRGEVPDGLVRDFPPPSDLVGTDREQASALAPDDAPT